MKKNNTYDVLRWVLLAPIVLLTWYIIMLLLAHIPHLMIAWGFENLWGYIEIPALIIGFLLPCIAVYFVAKYIAPKYKNIAGWSAVVFCPLCFFALWWLYALGY